MKDLVVVYMDASYSQHDNKNFVGLGIYIIDENGMDTKICKGFQPEKNRITKASMAELYNVVVLQQYISNNIKYADKKLIVYADCEDVVKLLNDKECQKNFGFKNKIRKQIASLNIENAYWVKGHAREKGNNFVDIMAYNAMKKALDNGEDFESITHNKTLEDIFTDVKRIGNPYLATVPAHEINKVLYERAFLEKENFVNKIDSSYYKNKIVLIDSQEHHLAEIDITDKGEYILNNKNYGNKSFKNIIDLVFVNIGILKEMGGERKNVLIKFKDNNLHEEIMPILDEAYNLFEEMKQLGVYKKESKELFVEKQQELGDVINIFQNKSEKHASILRIVKNTGVIVEKNTANKIKMKR